MGMKRGPVLDKMIDREKIEAMCARIDNNADIARYLGCTMKQVATIRASMARRRSRADERAALHNRNGEAIPDAKPQSAHVIGSRDLLRAMLLAGQHNLDAAGFERAVAFVRGER